MMDREASRRKYAQIIDLPHHQSSKRRHMPLGDRAAQFAPFAALSGYEDMVIEEARLTDSQTELTENETEWLNAVFTQLADRLSGGEHPAVEVTFFVPDAFKEGGRYETLTARLKKIDAVERRLLLYGGEDILDRRIPVTEIPMDRVIRIEPVERS